MPTKAGVERLPRLSRSQLKTKRRSLQGGFTLLNAVKKQAAEARKAPTKGLMYVDLKINGRATRAMVDTGAAQHFVAGTEAQRLGLKLEKDSSRMKAVNSEAQPIHGIAKAVPVKLGQWEGHMNLTAVPLDDFQVSLGMEFLREIKAVPMPFVGSSRPVNLLSLLSRARRVAHAPN